jgi:hypothetical protein
LHQKEKKLASLMASPNPVKATSISSKSKEKETDLGLGNFGLAMGR